MQKMYTDYINSEWGYSLYATNVEYVVFDDSQGNRFVIFINTNNTFQMGYYNQYLGESYTTDSLNRAKAAMESHLKDITVIFNGIAYYRKGDLVRAIADFEAVLKIDPNYTEVKQFLEDARR